MHHKYNQQKLILALLVILALLSLLLSSCTQEIPSREATRPTQEAPQQAVQQQTPTSSTQPNNITLRAEDGIAIAATYYLGTGDGIILLHMLNNNRQAWTSFAEQLKQEGYAVITIDLRGHGDSDLDWHDFRYPSGETLEAENDFMDMLLDVKAANKYLNEHGKFARVIIGASIGANIAALYAEEEQQVQQLILLSPGLSYRGVSLPSGPLFDGKVLLVGAEDDEYSAQTIDAYARRIRGEYKTILYPGKDHGTELLKSEPELTGRILDWMKK